jgi:hypothetical protein
MSQSDNYLARPDRLPPSATLIAFRDALAVFLAADKAGIYAAPEAWGKARDDKEEAWGKLGYQEREAVRACERGE